MKWTDNETAILKRDYQFFGDRVEINRSKSAIRAKASSLGIHSENGRGKGSKAADLFKIVMEEGDPYQRLYLAVILQAYLDNDNEFLERIR